MAGGNLRKIQPGSGFAEVCSFSTLCLSNIQCRWGQIALPKASTRCPQSLEPCLMLLLWGGGEWEGNGSEVWQSATSSVSRAHVRVSSVPLHFYRQRNSPVGTLLKMYVKNILTIDSILRLKIIKGKWIFIMLFLTFVDYTTWRISVFSCFGLWALYSYYCMLWFFCKAFLKSETAVALRRSLCKVPCITLVFSSIFMIMSISVNWCGSLQNHRMFLELLNITHQCKLSKLNFIKQNIHVLCNMKSYECYLIKIIKG